jgi:hypothetical protein
LWQWQWESVLVSVPAAAAAALRTQLNACAAAGGRERAGAEESVVIPQTDGYTPNGGGARAHAHCAHQAKPRAGTIRGNSKDNIIYLVRKELNKLSVLFRYSWVNSVQKKS